MIDVRLPNNQSFSFALVSSLPICRGLKRLSTTSFLTFLLLRDLSESPVSTMNEMALKYGAFDSLHRCNIMQHHFLDCLFKFGYVINLFSLYNVYNKMCQLSSNKLHLFYGSKNKLSQFFGSIVFDYRTYRT